MKNFKRILSLVLSVLLICGTVAVAFAADSVTAEAEDNNSFDEANTITSPTLGVTGSLSDGEDVDHFIFTQKAAGYAQLVFTHPESDSEKNCFVVELYKSDKTTKVTNFTVACNEEETKSSSAYLEAGNYYIKVSGSADYLPDAYTIKVVSVTSKYSTESEPNNEVAAANSILSNSTRYMGTIESKDDVDYYSFTASKGYVKILFLNGSQMIDGADDSNFTVTIKQYEKKTKPELNTIFTKQIDENDVNSAKKHQVQFPDMGVDAGIYYIEVKGTNGATGVYGIEVCSESDNTSESEYNGAIDYADEIKNGAYLFGATSSKDDVDYFKITTSSSESSTIKVEKGLSSQTLTGAWTVELQDSKGSTIESKTVTDKAAAEFSLASKSAGTYYVKITSSGDNGVLYKISATKVAPSSDSSSSSSSGSSWDNLWSTIKKMDWGAWWNKNFSFLSKIDWQTTISQLLKGSLGTILKYFLSNLTA